MKASVQKWIAVFLGVYLLFYPTVSFSQEPLSERPPLEGVAAPMPENAGPGDLLRMKEAGIRWATLTISRQLTEKKPGRYDTAHYDAVLKAALKRDVGLLVVLPGAGEASFQRWARKVVIDIRRRGLRRAWELNGSAGLSRLFSRYFPEEIPIHSSFDEKTQPAWVLSHDEEVRSKEISRKLILGRADGAVFDRLSEWNEEGGAPRKSVFYAVRAFTRFLSGHRFLKRAPAGEAHTALLFENEKTGEIRYAAWTDGEAREVAVPVEPGEYTLVSYRGKKLGNVMVSPEESGAILPLDDSPKYLIRGSGRKR